MNTSVPPVVEAYLSDLDRALSGADPRERAETLAAVRDHALESLAGDGGDDAVARVLDELGPVDEIAAAATPATTPGATPDGRTDGWLLACSIAGLLLFWVPPLAITSLIWAIAQLRSRSGNRSRQVAALWISIAALAAATLAAAGLASAGGLGGELPAPVPAGPIEWTN